MFCRAGNLAGQQVTSFARHRDLPLECRFGRQSGTETGSQGTPLSAKLARYYQLLMDSGEFEGRAALARDLGVSRPRATQVLGG